MTCAISTFLWVSDEFMQAVRRRCRLELVHTKEPDASAFQGYYQRADGKWVYRKVGARDLWQQIMESTYDHAEPGVLFMSKINSDNNLVLLRSHRIDQSVWRAAFARLWLLRFGLYQLV